MIREIERPDLNPEDKEKLDFIFVDDVITHEELKNLIEIYGFTIGRYEIIVKDKVITYIGVPGTVKMVRGDYTYYYGTGLWHRLVD